jgi:hypothetical protein
MSRLLLAENREKWHLANSALRETAKPPREAGVSAVAPTGVDPVTFRFSVGRSTN